MLDRKSNYKFLSSKIQFFSLCYLDKLRLELFTSSDRSLSATFHLGETFIGHDCKSLSCPRRMKCSDCCDVMTVNLFIYWNQSENIEMLQHLNALDTHQTNNKNTQYKMPQSQFEVSKEKPTDFENKSDDILDVPHVSSDTWGSRWRHGYLSSA